MSQTIDIDMSEWDHTERLDFIKWLIDSNFNVTYKNGIISATIMEK